MKRKVVLFALLAMSSPARADAEFSSISCLTGTWTSDSDVFGAQAYSTIQWQRVLDDQFYRLDYQIEMTQSNGERTRFAGVAFYRADETSGFWVDNSGDLMPIVAQKDDTALIAHWGRSGSKQGRTRYELLESGELLVTDWVLTEDGWRQFNQNTYSFDSADGRGECNE